MRGQIEEQERHIDEARDAYNKGVCKQSTVFDLITTHTPIRAQSSNFLVIRLQAVTIYFFVKAYAVGTHLICLDKSRLFKCVLTTYAFIKIVGNKIA